jgi:hypothetical protein
MKQCRVDRVAPQGTDEHETIVPTLAIDCFGRLGWEDRHMRKTIALATTTAFLLTLGCGPKNSGTTTMPSGEEVLGEDHHSDYGFEMDVVVTRSSDGAVVSRADAKDPTTGDTAEIWTDGTMIKWTGTIGGQPVSGSSAASDVLNPEEPTTTACLHPVAALICIGAAAALLAGCAFGFSCEGTEPGASNPPEGGGGVPAGGEGEEEPEEDTGD